MAPHSHTHAGSLPSSLPEKLEGIILDGNSFSGDIPPSWTHHLCLTTLSKIDSGLDNSGCELDHACEFPSSPILIIFLTGHPFAPKLITLLYNGSATRPILSHQLNSTTRTTSPGGSMNMASTQPDSVMAKQKLLEIYLLRLVMESLLSLLGHAATSCVR